MGAFLLRCPNTGQHVQGWSAEEIHADDDRYESIACAACQRVNLINRRTGKVAGARTE